MKYPKFSVAMCVYGGDDAEWFQTSVESLLNQTAPPDEVVLVVDGPVPEGLGHVISHYEKDARFKVVRLAENQGHGNARRVSLEHCSHELVALMDADDISVPRRFELQLDQFLQKPELSIVGGNISEFCGEPDHIVGVRAVPQDDMEIKDYMKYRCPMNQVTVMFRKRDVDAAGGYIDWYCEEDYYLWLRMSLQGMKFSNVPEVLCNVRVGEDMYQRRGGRKYFLSEAKLQKYMLNHEVIGFGTYLMNVAKRLIVQVLLPNRLRGWVFQKFARSKQDYDGKEV